jgi:hypothetical protein
MIKRVLTAALLLAMCFATPTIADELRQRQELTETVTTRFFAEDFDALERLATEFRTGKSRSASGTWRLTHFYYAFNSALPSREKDDGFWSRANAIADRWVQRYPRSPTAHMVRATVLVRHGWKFRGGGYASSVDPAAWPPFFKKLGEAKDYLRRHKDVASVDPHWYDSMAQIATAEGWDSRDFEALVDEGLTREPLYYQLYFSAVTFYLPKWGGDAGQIESFANAAVKRTQKEEGYALYARIYWVASQYQYGSDLFTRTGVVWPKMKRGIADVLARYPDQWNINNFAHFACLAGDRDEARKLIGRMSGVPIMQAWKTVETFSRCQAWAA